MRYLFENPKRVVEKDALINKVWGLDNDFESNSLEVFISFVRTKAHSGWYAPQMTARIHREQQPSEE